jgi:hypothetical protein
MHKYFVSIINILWVEKYLISNYIIKVLLSANGSVGTAQILLEDLISECYAGNECMRQTLTFKSIQPEPN